MKYKHFFLVLLFSSNLVFCQTIKDALFFSKENKDNLEKVLNHYVNTGEKEKYKAALFLIKNMPIHKSIKYNWFDKENKDIHFSEFNYPDYKIAYEALDSLKNKTKLKAKKIIENDINYISSDLLINNIEISFFEWKNNPWSKNYTLENFLEYILPYRSLIEPLEDWKKKYKALANRSKYTVENNDDPVEICSQIINNLEDFTFINNRPGLTPILSPNQMLFRKQGSCPDLANFSLMICRSIGLATTFDFTPHYAASSNRHFWNSIVNKEGKHIPFNSNAVNESDNSLPYLYNPNKKRLGKVFRKTFSIQKNSLAYNIPISKIPDSFLREKNIKDVTPEYRNTSSITIKSSLKQKKNDTIAYLNVFNKGRWRVIDWGLKKGSKLFFKNLGKDIVYLPSFYKNKKMYFEKFPYLLNKKGITKRLKPKFNKKTTINITRDNENINSYIDFNTLEILEGNVYRLYYWNDGWKKINQSKANKKGVKFNNIPSNALLLLLPEKPDSFERIFTLQKGTNKIFWY